ncbi:urease accessory protein UreF [Aurantimonas sp. VKM B-3413]|uniref:urease accessory protein UreF n=1 Tax=Aurantimonas sp. VKM B-3413 TaxID=2779401 RepID=UPI001E478066|nr:urease accessory protein UreF [Aurantimonas sp. VKM B-3413]MCB8839019.1 urease accessory protein UreF [Aurantimonas sp. VKM B-3413]
MLRDGDDTARRHLPTLLTLFSPAFPVGGFAYSHGLETAVREGTVADGADVEAWVRLLLRAGSGWNDLVLLTEAFHAAEAGDSTRLAEVEELAEALSGSAERRMETLALGVAFAEASQPWLLPPAPAPAGQAEDAGESGAPPYPVAVGRLVARAGLPLAETLAAYAHGFAASLVSAAVRLVPLAQSEAVRILHRLEPEISAAAERASASTLDDLGQAALLSEIAAMRHETLRTRLFRS